MLVDEEGQKGEGRTESSRGGIRRDGGVKTHVDLDSKFIFGL
jgi:hypothetical protein